mgnify:CR=1 FL=1
MADKINDGGPAFPLPKELYEHSEISPYGMSLRDWFAGMAIQGMLAGRKCELANVALGDMISSAFVIADAALKAREIPQ